MPLVQQVDDAVAFAAAECELAGAAEAGESAVYVTELGKRGRQGTTVVKRVGNERADQFLIASDTFYCSGLTIGDLSEQGSLLFHCGLIQQPDDDGGDQKNGGGKNGNQ